nr:hypothetical protein [Tanacetum cinerariifolium]
MRFLSRHADTQVYGAIIPEAMTNKGLLDSVAYKTYFSIASGAEPPKSRKSQNKSDSATKRIKKEFHASHASGSGDGTDFKSRVPDEQRRKTLGTDEGSGTKLRVLDVPNYDSESEKASWGDSREDNDDENNSKEDSDGNDDNDDNNDDDDDGNGG